MLNDYYHCQNLAFRIMGYRKMGVANKIKRIPIAHDDPLAHVCLTHLLMGLIERGERNLINKMAVNI